MKLAVAYLTILIPFLFVASIVWTGIAPERLYHCSDDVPIVTAIPPFVHGAQVGDYFIAAPSMVYLIWSALFGAALLIPAVPILLFAWAHRIYSRSGLLQKIP